MIFPALRPFQIFGCEKHVDEEGTPAIVVRLFRHLRGSVSLPDASQHIEPLTLGPELVIEHVRLVMLVVTIKGFGPKPYQHID